MKAQDFSVTAEILLTIEFVVGGGLKSFSCQIQLMFCLVEVVTIKLELQLNTKLVLITI